MTTTVDSHFFSMSGDHQLFPIFLTFQFTEFAHMEHNQIIRSTTYFIFLCFQAVYKACDATTKHRGRAVVNRLITGKPFRLNPLLYR